MPVSPDQIRLLLLDLGIHVRDRLRQTRQETINPNLSLISRESAADTIYEIDRISEEAIADWFLRNWPAELAIELVMEGVDPAHPVSIPKGTPVSATVRKVIIDPIDGTRGLMYDKRSAWFLAGTAPQKGPGTTLADVDVAVMVELPTSKQWRADCISGVRGQGASARSDNLLQGGSADLNLRPSRAEDVLHGFAYFSRFFPTGKSRTASLEEKLWQELGFVGPGKQSIIFEDQYICTGGQFYEVMAGHDRMIADLRPQIYAALGIESELCCHPYDACTSLLATELHAVIEKPEGGPLDAPLDTTSPVSWVIYANEKLARRVRPVLHRLLEELAADAATQSD